MYKTKKDVDKHVENLIAKLSVKEFKSRAYSVARLYFEVGDYVNCQRYVEQYLTQKDNNAAAHKLLAQALQKLGQKEKALEQYKISLDIDPTQTSTIINICELLADDEVIIDPGRAKYWCEKAEATFPRHPVTFRLRERLVTMANPDPEALVKLLTSELAVRPKDVTLHARLLQHYLHTNQFKEAFDHSCKLEFSGNTFKNSYIWYDTLAQILKHDVSSTSNWLYQLFLLTVRERICVLSLTETPTGLSKSLVESSDLLHAYDQAIETVAKAGAPPGFGDFHASLLLHHRGQFSFHAATFLLKKAKKDQLSWRDATKLAASLMLIAWHTGPLDPKVNWLSRAPEKQQVAVHRWYTEGAYRCSQAGHYILSNVQDKSQSYIDQVSQYCSGTHWRDKLYEKIFTSRDHLSKIKTSHFVSNAFSVPILRLPRKIEVEAYDNDAQREYPSSLHHFVWIILNYKNYADFKCSIFDMLTPSLANCGPETLNKLDIHAFLFCAALTNKQQRNKEGSYVSADKPVVLPANITDLLCPLIQMKWWDCAYKFTQNELGPDLTDIRVTLTRGIEVVRCIDNHGLDPMLLCTLGGIFSERAKHTTAFDEKNNLEVRAGLYYSSAIPLLEKLKNKITVKVPEKRLFDYVHKELTLKEVTSLIEESKLYVAINHINDCEYENAIDLLNGLKSPQAYYHLSQAYSKIAFNEKNSSGDISFESKSKHAALLLKAKSFAYKALDKIKEMEISKSNPFYSDVQQLIEELEKNVNKLDPDVSSNCDSNVDIAYMSDEDVTAGVSERNTLRNNRHMLRNISSTPKQSTHANSTNYRTAIDSNILDSTRVSTINPQLLENIEIQLKSYQKKTDDFMEQTKTLFEENKRMGNQIINTLQSDIQNTTDQFKTLKISVAQVKDQIDECRNECKDVGDLKKQVAELKKEVNKLKKASSEQTIDESDLYNLDEDYRSNEASSFSAQLPYQAPPIMPPFNQRLIPQFPVPPNPYQLNYQSLYNLYNQYSQFAPTPTVPGAPPLFDPSRTPVNYPGVYPTPEQQMYLDIAQLIPPSVPPTVPTMTSAPTVSVPIPATSISTSVNTNKLTSFTEPKEIQRSLPVNVVITTSDPLPTCTTAPQPVLSVTIPPKHIKGIPHNYQIPMPSTNETPVMSPPIFSFPSSYKPSNVSTASSLVSWGQPLKTMQSNATMGSMLHTPKCNDVVDNSTNVTDVSTSPNVSLNKSRTLSERSNTSVENYDPCPDFKPIIPLPAEVKVTTGEEEETAIFKARAKLYRFVDKQWKERGIGEIKLLKHELTGKVRVLMRREQIHKICANHIISSEMEIMPMKNETKAYFWVANDFADEAVVLEKFCIRFKTADIALQFYNTFEKARLDTKNSSTTVKIEPSVSQMVTHTTKTEPNVKPNISTTAPFQKFTSNPIGQPVKTEFGGFTFSGTPTFRDVSNDSKIDNTPSEPNASKVNVFSSISFKPANSSLFENMFGTIPNTVAASISAAGDSPVGKQDNNKLNSSDTVDEYEPNVEFKPVIPLPALIDQKTGEEDEQSLFEHRAKLLRFDASSKEWKERGLGNIKLMVHKENTQKVRLLMRREQIMKVCCNHAVTKDMTFQKMPNMDKAVTWCAKDFSDGELVAETFCLRFKTVQACDEFIEALKSAQSKMTDESKAAKEEQNAAKLTSLSQNIKSAGWGEKFKPKVGSWECDACLIRNEGNVDYCCACNSPRDANMPKKESSLVSENAPKFSFGIPSQTTVNTQKKEVTSTSAAVSVTGWGDKFKPKQGSWECKECFVRNESSHDKCSACASPKDPNVIKETLSIFGTPTSGTKFSFGIPPTANVEQKPKTEVTSIFDGTGAHKFSFGIPSTQEKTASVMSFGEQKLPTFGVSEISSGSETPVNLSYKTTEEASKSLTPKPALLPTPQTDCGILTTSTFEFVYKPKTTSKGKSPIKSPGSHKGDESDGTEDVSEDEGHHIHFNPVIPMPDKVDVVTGEENEDELYGHRAKLFRFISGEWKERGIGVVKILKHKETGKLRVVMRREQVHKICLNHALTSDIIYTPKDDKTWLFAANDFSEGELSLEQFCLRFKTKDIVANFKDAIEKSRGSKTTAETKIEDKQEIDQKDSDSDDVVIISEIQATAEEKQKAIELMLPENFYTYNKKEPCPGCRGCKDDDENNTIISPNPTKAPQVSASTPKTIANSSFFSAANSFYGTPVTSDKSSDDATNFRTPLGGSNRNSNTPSTDTTFDSTGKENTFTHKSISAPNNDQSVAENISGFGKPSIGSKSSILAPPKLSTFNTSQDENKPSKPVFGENKLVFGAKKIPEGNQSIFETTLAERPRGGNGDNATFSWISNQGDQNSIFGNHNTGISTNQSIFSVNSEQKQDNDQKPEVRSIFGADSQNPVNLFSGSTLGSIFGPGALKQNASDNIFGTGTTGKSIFGTTQNPAWNFGSNNPKTQPDQAATVTAISEKKIEEPKPEEPANEENLFKVDDSLTFAALSSSGAKSFSQDKKNNFKWDGAGQQLFVGVAKTAGKEGADQSIDKTGDTSGGADEEYDPHYEPIVPLPDKIVVTTGEEDEEKLFGERCKLYRYDDKTREWKERGVGEMKILYHSERKTYRLLLRREQIHKAVLNMLLFMDLELLPMKNSEVAWTWAARNFAESTTGEQETLAVRFKTVELAKAFRDKVTECVRKLQSAAAQAKSSQPKALPEPSVSVIAPLRLPKHLEESSRADSTVGSPAQTQWVHPNGEVGRQFAGESKQVHFQVPQADDGHEDDEYEHDYDDYDAHYNDEEDESGTYFSCAAEAIITQGEVQNVCDNVHVQVVFDQEVYSPKIMVTDADTGEILVDMLIHTETEFQLTDKTCSWSGLDFTTNDAVEKSVTLNLEDADTAIQFYDSCETSKASAYSSNEPEA